MSVGSYMDYARCAASTSNPDVAMREKTTKKRNRLTGRVLTWREDELTWERKTVLPASEGKMNLPGERDVHLPGPNHWGGPAKVDLTT